MIINWSSLLSALIGGVFVLFGVFLQYKTQEAHNKKNEQRVLKSLLQAIHDEIETVYERYQETMGSQLEALSDNQPLLLHYPLNNDFFSVFHGNTSLIGKIESNDLRKQIIKTYILAKGIIDSYRMNNYLLQQYEQAYRIHQETGSQIHLNHANAQYSRLIEYAKSLKKQSLRA